MADHPAELDRAEAALEEFGLQTPTTSASRTPRQPWR